MKAGLDKVKPLPKDKERDAKKRENESWRYNLADNWDGRQYREPPAKKESKPSKKQPPKKQPPKKKQAPQRIYGPDETDVFISGDVIIDWGQLKKYNPRGAPRKVKD